MKKLNLLFINILIFLIFCSFSEFVARFIFTVNKEKNKHNFRDELLEKAYLGIEDEYYQFFADCPKQRIISKDTDGSSVRYANPNFSCGGITVKNNKRLTVDQKSPSTNILHVFGGSTVFGIGASDKYTIPSLLQKKFNDIGSQTKVINHGFASLVAIQQFQKLTKTDIKKGDIVVFYDGGNDIVQREIYGRPEGTIIGYNQENKIGFLFSELRNYLSENSKIYYYLGKLKLYSQGKAVSQKVSKCEPNTSSKKEFEKKWLSYYQTLVNAKNFSESKNASFYHFLQPILDYDLLEKSDLNYLKAVGIKGTYDLCFIKLLSRNSKNLNSSYLNFLNNFNGTTLSDVLINSSVNSNPGYYFIDYIHITRNGNEIVANAIFKKISKD